MSTSLSVESLSTILGRQVEEIHLTIAKASVLGLDVDSIAQTIGIDTSEIRDLCETQDYKDIRLLVGAEHAKDRVERDLSWDGVENTALKKLGRRAELENDTDTLLRIAAVANKAIRRTNPNQVQALDPSTAHARVPLTLTRRFVEKLNNAGAVVERQEIQQISVLNGSAVNPKFSEVADLLRPTDSPRPASLTGTIERTPGAVIESTTSNEADEPFTIESIKAMARSMRR